jgi:hypothetical protein
LLKFIFEFQKGHVARENRPIFLILKKGRPLMIIRPFF